MILPKEAQGRWLSEMCKIVDYKMLKKSFLTIAKEMSDKEIISDIKTWIRENKESSIGD
jgi:hypothetical protein